VSTPYVAEIRIFAGNFAPTGHALCDGQILPITQNTALFSLLGTNYGGNGTSTFGLPNLQGMAPRGAGQGAGLSLVQLGEQGGEAVVTLTTGQMPAHTHALEGAAVVGDQASPQNHVFAEAKRQKFAVNEYASAAGTSPASGAILETTGGSQPHNNLPPYLVTTFIIALTGVYPPRS
jgi:microcystin-dependent protein